MGIIKRDENGVGFYTAKITGQSGMSPSGLAILASVDKNLSSIQKLPLGLQLLLNPYNPL